MQPCRHLESRVKALIFCFFHSYAYFYALSKIQISATIVRFYMTTQSRLSAATPASWEPPRLKFQFAPRIQWHRHSCLCAVAWPGSPRLADPSASLAFQALIANARLESRTTHKRISPLQIPNRERMGVSRIASEKALLQASSRALSLIATFLIYGGAIKHPPNSLKT